jgi:uncharacterized phage protein gp47/JayE
MYEDKTFDDLMSAMMDSFGQNVRTDEGSLAYNACCKIAEKLEDVYGDMDQLNDNMLMDTQDIDHLIRYAAERGISYHYATAPVVRGSFQQEIEVGERLVCGDYTYTVTALLEGFDYKLTCETEGTEANANLGTLDPVDYIDEYLGGEITEIITPGTDDEDEDVFRQRVIDSFDSAAFGGNKADYRLYIDAISGVGGCKPKRRSSDSPWINITVISGEYGAPSATLIAEIQDAVDPEQSHGEGDGMAPICHNVMILPVNEVEIDIEVTVTFDTGYSQETSQNAVESAVEEYLLTLRKGWESNELNDTVVRIAQIEARLLTVEGVLDVSDTTINGEQENALVAYTGIPVLGGVVIHV